MTPTIARHRTSLPTCEAHVGVAPGLYGLEPVRCRQTVGLRVMHFEVGGDLHFFCVAPGHRERVIAQARRLGLVR